MVEDLFPLRKQHASHESKFGYLMETTIQRFVCKEKGEFWGEGAEIFSVVEFVEWLATRGSQRAGWCNKALGRLDDSRLVEKASLTILYF